MESRRGDPVLDRRSGAVTHTRFDAIGAFLRAGDLLVFNDSRTLPALLSGRTSDGEAIEVRLARGRLAAEVRRRLLAANKRE